MLLYLQLVVLKDRQSAALQELHGGRMGGYLGEERTCRKLQERFCLLPKFQGMVLKLSTLCH